MKLMKYNINTNLTELTGWHAGSVISFCATIIDEEAWGWGMFSDIVDVDINKRRPKKFS
jgi:hypothetical protein